MLGSFRRSILCFLVIVAYSPTLSAGLTINLDFTSFNSGTNVPSSNLGGATLQQAGVVIETAAQYWEKAFENSLSSISWATGGMLTQNISVGWADHSGSVLATGGTTFYPSGQWSAGSLTWDSSDSNFFVDLTPTENSEWGRFSGRSHNFGGDNQVVTADMNVERNYFDAPAGTARDGNDMLTVAIHEIGHAIGFLGGNYPLLTGSITSGPFAGSEIPIDGSHTVFQLEYPVGGMFPHQPEPGYTFGPGQIYPNVMGPSIMTGTRKLLTEVDIAIVAQFLKFDMNTVNFNPTLDAVAIPEPSSLAMMGVGISVIVLRRKRRR